MALALTATVAGADAQSVYIPLEPVRLAYLELNSGYAPHTTVSGISVLRSQEAFDAFWSANNGRPGLKGGKAPWKLDFEKWQLVAIVLPPSLQFDAIPTVAGVFSDACTMRIEIAPRRGWSSPGVGRLTPYVLVRTPVGHDCFEVALYDPAGRPTATIAAKAHRRPIYGTLPDNRELGANEGRRRT